MKRLFTALAIALCLLSIPSLTIAQSVLYGTTGGAAGSGTLYTIDPTTGTATAVGALVDGGAGTYGVTGLAFDTATGVLYGSTTNNSITGAQSLVAIDPNTGTVTYIGSFAISGTMADLTFDAATSTLYGSGSLNGNLYSIDVATGLATPIGTSGLSLVQGVGLAIDNLGTIYGAPNGANGDLVTYDKVTGAATSFSTLSGGPYADPASISALTFDSNGTLFGVDLDRGDPARGTSLVTINPATGLVSNIGVSVNNLDAIAFGAVPEPGSVMLIGMGLCFIAITARRRYTNRRLWR